MWNNALQSLPDGTLLLTLESRGLTRRVCGGPIRMSSENCSDSFVSNTYYRVRNEQHIFVRANSSRHIWMDPPSLKLGIFQGASPQIFEWGTNRWQVADLSPKYPTNRKRHWIWAISFSNLEGTFLLFFFSMEGTRPLRLPRFRRPWHFHLSRSSFEHVLGCAAPARRIAYRLPAVSA